MEATRYIGTLTMQPPDKPVAWVFGLPMLLNEALAFQAWSANVATPEQLDTLLAWKVAMTLAHGSWVGEQLPLET